MKRMIRGYLAFAPVIYRIMAMVLLPCMLIAVRIWYQAVGGGGDEFGWLFELFAAYCYITLEGVTDYWLFGGLCCSRIGQPLLLRSSARGLGLLRMGLIGDLLRRFVWIMGYSLVGYLISGEIRELVTGLFIYLIITADLNLSRHVENPQYLLLCVQPGVLLFMIIRTLGIIFELMNGTSFYIIEISLLLPGTAVVSALTIWHMMYCVKKSIEQV